MPLLQRSPEFKLNDWLWKAIRDGCAPHIRRGLDYLDDTLFTEISGLDADSTPIRSVPGSVE
jgi:hypothetical protein